MVRVGSTDHFNLMLRCDTHFINILNRILTVSSFVSRTKTGVPFLAVKCKVSFVNLIGRVRKAFISPPSETQSCNLLEELALTIFL